MKYGATNSYRSAAHILAELTGLRRLCHAERRKVTIACGEYIEDEQFRVGWFAGGRKRGGAKHLRVAIDGTVLRAVPLEEVRTFEVVAGHVERDGHPGRRFVCALSRRTLARMLIAAALEQSGWVRSTEVDVVTDGARGMRGLVRSVAPFVAPKILDWFHLAMKLHAVKTPLSARTDFWVKRPALMVRAPACRARCAMPCGEAEGKLLLRWFERWPLRCEKRSRRCLRSSRPVPRRPTALPAPCSCSWSTTGMTSSITSGLE